MTAPRLPRLLWGPPDGGPRRPRVLLGCSGSVATIKVPVLAQQLQRRGAQVIVVPTRSALHFLRAAAEAQAPAAAGAVVEAPAAAGAAVEAPAAAGAAVEAPAAAGAAVEAPAAAGAAVEAPAAAGAGVEAPAAAGAAVEAPAAAGAAVEAPAAAGAEDCEVDYARFDSPLAPAGATVAPAGATVALTGAAVALTGATVARRDVFEGIVDREGKGLSGSCDTDTSPDFKSTLKCNNKDCYLGAEQVLEANRDQESEVRGCVRRKRCASDKSGAVEEGNDCGLSRCCTIAGDGRPTPGTDPRLPVSSVDCAHRSCKCEVGLGKLCHTRTVHTQTEVFGVNYCPIEDSCDKTVNSSGIGKPKNNHGNNSNLKTSARLPSHCLSCLKMLEAAALGSFKTKPSNTAPAGTSLQNNLPNHARPPSVAEDITSPAMAVGRDMLAPSCEWCATQRLLPGLVLAGDALEWEGWRGRGDPVLHIELRRWADLEVIAPLSANTLAKLANGLCDNLLTCVARAWDTNKPLLFCPAMNTHMYEHPFTGRQIAALVDLGYVEVPVVSKRLVCGDVGGGAMAEVETIVEAVWAALQQHLGPIATLPPTNTSPE